ncbi:MAG: dienelactone hydrolase family protein [Planctomycetia bacterium]|nr:dienelactone hydrolase family protein [Planctomycetia bacterium]
MRRVPFVLLLVLVVGCGGSRAPVAIPEAAELKKLPPGTHRQSADVPGVGAVNYAIEVPPSADGQTPVPLVLVLHYGYDGAKPEPYTGAEMIDAFRPGLSGLGAIVIAPDALGGKWTDSNNEKAAIWLVKSVMKTYPIDSKKVIVTGFSLGGEGAWFLGSRHQNVFTGAIPVAAPIAGGDVEWKIPVYVIHSDHDEIVTYNSAKRHADTLKGKGAKLEFKTVRGLSHYSTNQYGQFVGEGVKWLQAEWK